MNQNQAQAAPNVDLKNTTSIETPNGNKIFQQGVILRQVSKFVVGASEDAILPIPVFYDPETGKVLEQTLPKELREEFKDDTI
jgi:hypothetical protein|tara:strand:- start:158 stop:406 length:249 start_codon:yes stop_codon:yes gene_type:complete